MPESDARTPGRDRSLGGPATRDGGPSTSADPARRADPAGSGANGPLLSVTGLQVGFRGRNGRTHQVLTDVGFSVVPGEIVGLIGETGSGKTTLGRAIVGLVTPDSGTIRFENAEIQGLRGARLRALRRRGPIRFVFQDPLRSLDPDQRVGDIIAEGLAIRREPHSVRRQQAGDALTAVGLTPGLLDRLPGELSGGQRQRVAIARAIVTRPRLLICDEPVSALDAASRAHVVRLLVRLRDEQGIAMVVITHDLAGIVDLADRVLVLHAGRIVEEGPPARVLSAPEHPYTRLLVASHQARATRAGETPTGIGSTAAG